MREVERRIQRAEKSVPEDLTVPEVPAGVPSTFQEHLKLLMDLQLIAFQADITRVSTLMFARELSGAVFPETNIRDPFHNLSHHSNDRGNMDRFAQLNTYHMTKFAYLVEKLKNTPDGDGSLLDHSVVLYGSSLSDGNQHNFSPLPIVLAGGASGRLKGGRHLIFPKDTRMSNLLLAMLDTLGVRPRDIWRQHRDAYHLAGSRTRAPHVHGRRPAAHGGKSVSLVRCRFPRV